MTSLIRWVRGGFASMTLAFAGLPMAAQGLGPCRFDPIQLEYPGPAAEQADCLLRKVKPKGAGSISRAIPDGLRDRVGTASVPDVGNPVRWLQAQDAHDDPQGFDLERWVSSVVWIDAEVAAQATAAATALAAITVAARPETSTHACVPGCTPVLSDYPIPTTMAAACSAPTMWAPPSRTSTSMSTPGRARWPIKTPPG